jgi:hypothetical protein
LTRVFATPEDLCASSAIDAVYVTSPDALHLPHVLLALGHCKPVLCEKLLGMKTSEVEQMLAAASALRQRLSGAQNFRYNISLEVIRDWIAAGRIGQPASAPLEAYAAIGLNFTGSAMGTVTVSTRGAYRSHIEVTGVVGAIVCINGLSVDQNVEVLLLREGNIVDRTPVSSANGYTRMLDSFSNWVEGTASSGRPVPTACIISRCWMLLTRVGTPARGRLCRRFWVKADTTLSETHPLLRSGFNNGDRGSLETPLRRPPDEAGCSAQEALCDSCV